MEELNLSKNALGSFLEYSALANLAKKKIETKRIFPGNLKKLNLSNNSLKLVFVKKQTNYNRYKIMSLFANLPNLV